LTSGLKIGVGAGGATSGCGLLACTMDGFTTGSVGLGGSGGAGLSSGGLIAGGGTRFMVPEAAGSGGKAETGVGGVFVCLGTGGKNSGGNGGDPADGDTRGEVLTDESGVAGTSAVVFAGAGMEASSDGPVANTGRGPREMTSGPCGWATVLPMPSNTSVPIVPPKAHNDR
jgi:hypothetical protein